MIVSNNLQGDPLNLYRQMNSQSSFAKHKDSNPHSVIKISKASKLLEQTTKKYTMNSIVRCTSETKSSFLLF